MTVACLQVVARLTDGTGGFDPQRMLQDLPAELGLEAAKCGRVVVELAKERKDASFRRLVAQRDRLGLHCRDLCPCIPPHLAEVMPPQGFHINTEEYPPFNMDVEGCEAFEQGGPRWGIHAAA